MGPLAGVGDSWMQGVVWPILLSLGAGMAVEGNFFGPFAFLIPYLAQMYFIGWNTFRLGYEQGKSTIAGILGNKQFKIAIEALTILGMLVLGTMAAQRIGILLNLNFMVGKHLSISNLFVLLLPGLTSLGLIGIVYFLLSKK